MSNRVNVALLAVAVIAIMAIAMSHALAAPQQLEFNEENVYNLVFRPYERGMIYDGKLHMEIPLCLKYKCDAVPLIQLLDDDDYFKAQGVD